jgi:hypothetical protein
MARGPATFRKRDVIAAVKAVVAAGVEVARVEVDALGKIVVVAAKAADQASHAGDDLDRELAEFEARHADRA